MSRTGARFPSLSLRAVNRSTKSFYHGGAAAAGARVLPPPRQASGGRKMSDHRDEVAIITGGTRGIGAAIADALAARGVRLVLNGRNRDADVDATIAGLRKTTEVELDLGDAADPATAARVVATARSRFGRDDCVVPAAGGPHPPHLTHLSPP